MERMRAADGRRVADRVLVINHFNQDDTNLQYAEVFRHSHDSRN